MSPRIRVLPEGVVNQIAAGEVVERPASVLKELVENALDADAARIEITLDSAGQERIAVADDGAGMTREDALLAFERHATSKIDEANDLERIATYGFRGEALPSIAAVSRLTLETAPREGGEGTRIRIEGGEVVAVDRIARAPGTTVDVRHLFYNTPARRKFLRTHATEQAHVVQRLTEDALVRPGVGWHATHGPRLILDLSPVGSLRERLAGLFDLAYVETLLPVGAEVEGVAVHGFAQRAAAAGASRRRQFVFVNDRPVDVTEVARAAIRGYRSTLPRGARPDFFLFVEVEPELVDVNVHPTKREVRFREPARVAGAVEEAVRDALGAGPVAARPYRVGEPAGGERGDRDRADARRSRRAPERPETSEAPAPSRRTPTASPSRGTGQLGLFFSGRRPGGEEAMARPESSAPEESDVEPDIDGDAIERPVGPTLWQLHERFILAQTASGLAIVDQHSAHERILYEEVIDDLREGARPAQRLLFPQVLHLTPAQRATWESYRGLIDRLGFEIEPFGGDAIAVEAVPAFRHRFDAEDALAGLLDDLAEPGGGSADMNQHERVARLFACKAAIKAGTPLASEEMAELIDRLFATRLPYDDVHGRPAVLQVPLADLHRHFGRH
ncbi:MAG: DNA mismatch repair endonuclease MutL [Gemmatimonadota bacterium]|nr:DNA mismatch repair endonuclease MutL [Gemmatimonadota bacterium]